MLLLRMMVTSFEVLFYFRFLAQMSEGTEEHMLKELWYQTVHQKRLTGSFTKPLAHGFVAGYFLYPIKFFKTFVSCTVIGCKN